MARCLRPAGRRVYGDIERGSGRSAAQRSVAWRGVREERRGEGEKVSVSSRLATVAFPGEAWRGVRSERCSRLTARPRLRATRRPNRAALPARTQAHLLLYMYCTPKHYECTPRIRVPIVMHYELLLDSTRLDSTTKAPPSLGLRPDSQTRSISFVEPYFEPTLLQSISARLVQLEK